MMMRRLSVHRQALLAAFICTLAPVVVAAAPAPAPGVPNAVQGFSQNRDQPVKIESNSLEVRDKSHIATFTGNVLLTQGDTTLKCNTLVVFYEEAPKNANTASKKKSTMTQSTPTGNQQIKRVEAKGSVVVTQKDQTATGDSGVFELQANTMTLMGNVVVTQGQNVLRGDRLVVDLTTGVSRVESGKTNNGRVEGLFLPNAKDTVKPGTTPAPTPAKPAPSGPLRIN